MGEVEEDLKDSRALYLTGATQSVSDTIIDRFTGTIAVAAGATVGVWSYKRREAARP